jgi:D-glycerate 3-kinase
MWFFKHTSMAIGEGVVRDFAFVDILIQDILGECSKKGFPFVVGITGPQGSGKSTVSEELIRRLEAQPGWGKDAVVVISIDDLYVGKDAREVLAAEKKSNLLKKRGVPGTHDPLLGVSVIEALSKPFETFVPVSLPRFDKATDSPIPKDQWPVVNQPPKVIILEGWCVGASKMTLDQACQNLPERLKVRMNEPDVAHWIETWVEALGSKSYQDLFQKINYQVSFVLTEGLSAVYRNREQQEAELRDAIQSGRRHGSAMSPEDVVAFVDLFAPLTQHIQNDLPTRSNAVISVTGRTYSVQVHHTA